MNLSFLRSRWKSSLVAGVLSAVLTAGLLYLDVQSTQSKIQRLRQENEERSLKLLTRHAAGERPAPKPAALPDHTRTPATANPAPMPAVYRNDGQATPVATLQSFAWACDHGDVDALATLLTFESDGRAKLAAYVAKLPESQRAQWASPERLAATVCIAGYLRWPYPPADVIDLATVEPISADRVRLRLPGTALDGGNYLKTAEGWKFVIPNDGIEERLKSLTQNSSPK